MVMGCPIHRFLFVCGFSRFSWFSWVSFLNPAYSLLAHEKIRHKPIVDMLPDREDKLGSECSLDEA
jgi:hypothetical protein